MENVQNATQVRRLALQMWDAIIDLQDEVASLIALIENRDPIPPDTKAWVYRPGQQPEQVNLVSYAREVLQNAEKQ